MTRTPLPAAPAGFHYFGWQGILLLLPLEWNLTAFHGNAHRGSFAISDLHALQLQVRWQRPKRWTANPAKQTQQLIYQISKRQQRAKVDRLSETAARIDLESGEQLFLTHDAERLFELQCPSANDTAKQACMFFHDHLRHERDAWQWSAFGASCIAPKYARLSRVSLAPGAPRLALTHHGNAITCGALSMADQLLQGTTLQEVAERHLQLNTLNGTWKGHADSLSFNGETKRQLLPGTIPFAFQFTHDASANRIVWQLTTRTGFHRIWKLK